MSERSSIVLLVTLLLAVVTNTRAWAQAPPNPPPQQPTPFTGEVTVTATGVETDIDDAPTAVSVITRDEIDDAQAGSVAEMLRRVPGLSVVSSGDEGKVTSVFTRGTGSNQTLVMFDGIRLNSPYFGGFDWSRLSTTGLRQIEVVRGPYSALWGADAVGGVVNLIPDRGHSGFSGRFFGETGSFGRRRLEASAGWGGQSFDFYVAGFDARSDGSVDNSDYKTRQLVATFGWSFDRRGSRIGFITQDLDAATGIPFVTPGDPTPDRRQNSRQTLIGIPVTLVLSGSWNVEASFASVDGTFGFADPEDPYFTESTTDTTSYQARLASHHRIGRHTFTWGGAWRRDEVIDTSNLGANLDGEIVDVTSVFLQDVWSFDPAVHLLLGVRWDDSNPWGSEISPRTDLGWMLSDTVELRAGYGEAFRPPSLGELYFPFSGNADLVPETSRSADAGLTYTTRNRRSRWQVTAFATDLENLIEFDFITSANANIGSATIRGAEFSWNLPLARRGAAFLQTTYLDTKDNLGEPLLRRPRWSGSWTLHGAFSKHLNGDLTVVYVGSRDDVDPVTFERTTADSYTTADIALAYSLWNGVEITGRVLNVADTDYQEVLGYPAPGRQYLLGLRLGVDTASRWKTQP